MITGSAPYARGAHDGRARLPHADGISPHAPGAQRRSTPQATRCRDQPRTRGESGAAYLGSGRPVGSAPHSRGAQLARNARHAAAGISPAFARSTTQRSAALSRCRDQPRTRGKHITFLPSRWCAGGSASHARGARLRRSSRSHGPGISPARADLVVMTPPSRGAAVYPSEACHPRPPPKKRRSGDSPVLGARDPDHGASLSVSCCGRVGTGEDEAGAVCSRFSDPLG